MKLTPGSVYKRKSDGRKVLIFKVEDNEDPSRTVTIKEFDEKGNIPKMPNVHFIEFCKFTEDRFEEVS